MIAAMVPPEVARFVVVDQLAGHWNWTAAFHRGTRTPMRYYGRSGEPARRWVWRLAVGDVPATRLLRRCDSVRCVCPDHMEVAAGVRHGTRAAYVGGCHCSRCRKANADDQRIRARLAGVPARRRQRAS